MWGRLEWRGVDIDGTLNNTGTTLSLSAMMGSWTLDGGTITGGTITASGGQQLNSASGTLDGVTLASNLMVSPGSNLSIVNGLTLNGATVTLSGGAGGWYPGSASLTFSGTQTLSGTGTVVFAGSNGGNSIVAQGGNNAWTAATLTIGSGITIDSGGYGGSIGGSYSQDSIINEGMIDADVAGQTITVGTSAPWTNSGRLEASNGGTLTLGGPWNNVGTMTVSDATLNLGGQFTTTNVGTLGNIGGTVNITGTLNNTGTTLSLSATTGSWTLDGGTITGGTITASGGSS